MPQRIAVLLGIPTTLDEFVELAERESSWDYGRPMVAGRTPAVAYREIYEPVAAAASHLTDNAARGGYTVVRRASLGDFRDAGRRFDVIVLVAHWKGAWVQRDDMLTGWENRLSRDSSPESVLGLLSGSCRERSTDRFVDATNELIESGELRRFLPDAFRNYEVHPRILEALSRDLVDEAMAGALVPGNRLELFDGLHSMQAVDGALAGEFRGLLDLSCCTSSVLATFLQMTRGESAFVLASNHDLLPAQQLHLIAETLYLVHQSEGRASYRDARVALSMEVAKLAGTRAT
jgi:hypothetical protein